MKSKTEEQGKYMKQTNKNKTWPFEMLVAIDKTLASLIRKKRGKRHYKYQKGNMEYQYRFCRFLK